MKEELLEPLFRKMRLNKVMPWLPQNIVVCDIGCGFEAQFLRSISSVIKKGYGFDRKVKTNQEKNLEIQQYDLMNSLPLPDKSVDCVTLIAVLEHLSNVEDLFSEINRICHQGSRIIITTPTPSSQKILEFLSFRLGIVSPEEIADHKHYWSLPEIQALLERYNFRILKKCKFSLGLNSLVVGEKTT